MKEIALTQGETAIVDDCDFERLNQFKWFAYKCANTFYAGRNVLSVNGKHITFRMHWEVIGKPQKGFEVDHRNWCGIDNRLENLRFVTKRQNGQNRKNAKSTSKYPGVYLQKTSKKWLAQIQINGKRKHLGLFADERKAFEAYKKAVNELGETIIGK